MCLARGTLIALYTNGCHASDARGFDTFVQHDRRRYSSERHTPHTHTHFITHESRLISCHQQRCHPRTILGPFCVCLLVSITVFDRWPIKCHATRAHSRCVFRTKAHTHKRYEHRTIEHKSLSNIYFWTGSVVYTPSISIEFVFYFSFGFRFSMCLELAAVAI